jgi:hypothetical protein
MRPSRQARRREDTLRVARRAGSRSGPAGALRTSGERRPPAGRGPGDGPQGPLLRGARPPGLHGEPGHQGAVPTPRGPRAPPPRRHRPRGPTHPALRWHLPGHVRMSRRARLGRGAPRDPQPPPPSAPDRRQYRARRQRRDRGCPPLRDRRPRSRLHDVGHGHGEARAERADLGDRGPHRAPDPELQAEARPALRRPPHRPGPAALHGPDPRGRLPADPANDGRGDRQRVLRRHGVPGRRLRLRVPGSSV